jgi:predicted RNase H-like nuclease
MLVIGLDAAAQWKKFGYAIGHHTDGRISLESAGILGDAAGLAEKIGARLRASPDALIAIDAPLGWPKALGEALAQHQVGDPLALLPNELFRRVTDDHVHRLIGKRSLDVGADRIARAAWRALDVLGQLRHMVTREIPVLVEPWGRSGLGVIEVYPAATLKAHGIQASGYKDHAGLEARRAIARAVEPRVAGIASYAEAPDDVFDACLCLVAALDFLEGRAAPPEDIESARKEGWIWVRQP